MALRGVTKLGACGVAYLAGSSALFIALENTRSSAAVTLALTVVAWIVQAVAVVFLGGWMSALVWGRIADRGANPQNPRVPAVQTAMVAVGAAVVLVTRLLLS